MKLDGPECFVFSILGLEGWVISARLDRKIMCKYHITYNPFFSPILFVLFLCIIHPAPDGRGASIVSIRSGTLALDTTNDVHSPTVEVLLILI
jgi:hypothetical protein